MAGVGPSMSYDHLQPPPPPPPPPPPSPPSDSDQSIFDIYSIQSNFDDPEGPQKHQRLTTIEERQERLRDARDGLIGSRFRLEAQRRELGVVREDAGIQAGSAFSNIQTYLHEQNFNLPESIANAFNGASALRDKLGQMDAEYDEAEKDYNLREWKYTKVEAAFVDDFAGPSDGLYDPDATTAQENQTVPLQDLAHFSFSLSGTEFSLTSVDMHDDNVTEDLASHAGALTTQQSASLEDLQTPASSKLTAPASGVALTSYMTKSKPTLTTLFDTSEPYATTKHSWLRVRERVEKWLFDTVSCSRLQRAHLRTQTSCAYMEDQTWWDLVQQQWRLDNADGIKLHTGDSIVSYALATQPPSGTTEGLPLQAHGSHCNKFAMEMSATRLPHDLVLDTASVGSIPAALEPFDLTDVSNASRPSRSTVQRHEQMAAFLPSLTEEEFDLDFTASSVGEHSTQDTEMDPHHTSGAVAHGRPALGKNANTSTKETREELNVPCQTLVAPTTPTLRPSSGLRVYTYSPISNPEQTLPTAIAPSNSLSTSTPFAQRPMSPPKTRSPSPQSRHCPLFHPDTIGTLSNFLRLTPLPRCNCNYRRQHPSITDFVDNASSTRQLPGPSSSDALFD